MTNEVSRRGPDGEGYLITNQPDFSDKLRREKENVRVASFEHPQHISMGHRRLSTTDLSFSAAQPMGDVTGIYWAVFNGQIYNHTELRKELEAKGYKFATDHSDTEVLLNAFSCWGVNCLQKFNGMWAFCIWDSKKNKVFMSRDRMGKQPLFYAIADKTFYFASELNALLVNKNINQQLNERAIYDYLTYANIPAPDTILKNISKLQAGHYLYFEPGQSMESKQYWHPEKVAPANELREEEVVAKIRDILFEATSLRMKSDVNVGTLLSGGLDSSIILACMSKNAVGTVKAYTVGFENKGGYRNEIDYAKKVAALFNADMREVVVTEKEFFEFLPDMAYYIDEPIADTANIPIYFVSRLSRQGNIKVMLSGEGSDELFVGYQHWRLIRRFEAIFRNRPKFAAAAELVHKSLFLKHKGTHYHSYYDKIKNNWPVFWSGTEMLSEKEKRSVLTPGFLSRLGNYNSFMPKAGLYEDVLSNNAYDAFRWMTINDLSSRLPDQLLARLDRMMMAVSIEGRNPFLDVRLVEFMLSVPAHLKVKRKMEKYLLKKAFEGILPHEIIYRKKDSFTVPLQSLFTEPRKKQYMEVIHQFNTQTDIFSNAYIYELERPEKLNEFWNLLNLALWYEKHR